MKAQNMLVIGNGFDMFLGLNSSYKSFLGLNSKKGTYYNLDSRLLSLKVTYPKWKHSSIIIENDDLSLMKELFNIPRKIYSTVQRHINKKDTVGVLSSEQYFWKDTKYFDKDSIFKKISHVNFWSAYLILRKYNNDTNWYSIESEMYNFLTNRNTDFYEIANFLYYMLTGHQHNFRRINSFIWKMLPAYSNGVTLGKNEFQMGNNGYYYNDNRRFTIDELKGSISNINNSHPWLKTINVYSLVFLMLNVRSYYFKSMMPFKGDKPRNFDNLCCNLYNFLKKELTNFERDLDEYLLHTCIKQYKDKYKISYSIIGQRLLNCMSSSKPFSLVDFNYTTPFIEDYDFPDLRSIKNKLLVLRRNIHGRLIDPTLIYDTRKAPIIGISSNGIDINSPIYKFTKNYRIMRLSCNKYGDVFLHKNHVKEIKFFGQSFDAADYDYFFDIFDQFHINNSHVKLVFFYAPHGGQSDDRSAIHQINSIDSLFNHYCKDRLHKDNKYAKRLLHILSFEGRLIVININTQINRYPLLKQYINTVNITLIIENLKSIFNTVGAENIDDSKKFELLIKTNSNIDNLENDINYMLRSCNFKLKMREITIYNKLNKLSKQFITNCQTYSKLFRSGKLDKCISKIQVIIKNASNIEDDIAKFNTLKK